MHKHNWPMLLAAQAKSGQTIAAFCASNGLTASQFYAERAKLGSSKGLVPIVVEARELQITVQLRTPVSLRGSAADLAQLLRCL